MTDYSELKRLAEDVNAAFPDKEDLWNMVCTPTLVLDLIADFDQLSAELNRPDEVIAEPAADYDSLRKQFMALRMLCNSKAKQCEHWRQQSGDTVREAMQQIAANVDAERNINEQLTNDLLCAEALIEKLRKDAERYQWLRDSSESVHQFYLSTPIWFTGVKFSKENVDSTIDAAMSKEG